MQLNNAATEAYLNALNMRSGTKCFELAKIAEQVYDMLPADGWGGYHPPMRDFSTDIETALFVHLCHVNGIDWRDCLIGDPTA
jgi:hypothetical protein